MDDEARRAAQLLQERYGWNGVDPTTAMWAVHRAAYPLTYLLEDGEEPPPVPAEDILAALFQTAEARRKLDLLELGLIRAARDRSTPWAEIAPPLGLQTRQSAESRALRLERSLKSSPDREVKDERLSRARRRAGAAWAEENAEQIRAAAEDVVAFVPGAWADLEDSVLGMNILTQLRMALEQEAPKPTALIQALGSLKWELRPYGAEPVILSGPAAAEATAAVDKAAALCMEQWAAQAAIRSAADADRAKPEPAPFQADGTAR